ncbi:hypothetical protein ACFBZI_02580 [Moraxella sp. ZJ142]|uniref:hypothetical protein n=1 Tax=Moraxella marmotae TaxID=3344520 RepID=UPI0035D4A451
MGFFSSLCDGVKSVASATWEGVKSAASSVWEGAKKVARAVVDTAVESGGKIVGAVKTVYNAVKPYLKPAAEAIKTAATAASVYFPWAKTVGDAFAKGLEWLHTAGDNDVVKKISEAIEWALKNLRTVKESFFNEKEEEEAIKRQRDLNKAMSLMKTEEQRLSIRFAQLINEYILVKTRIKDALDSFETSNSNNFEHYLRLRATQKLLKITERHLSKAQELSEISDDDVFLIEMGNKLLEKKPYLTSDEGMRLDRLIQHRCNGKTLLPFVFEELIFSWNVRLNDMEEKWDNLNAKIAKLKHALRQLQVKQKIEGLSQNETIRLNDLTNEVQNLSALLEDQEAQNRAMQNYVYASEGFLQVLEKTEEQWIDEDREWVLEESSEVGMLLIDCVENNHPWGSLTKEQQSLISDFANVFAKDSQRRTEETIDEIEVA